MITIVKMYLYHIVETIYKTHRLLFIFSNLRYWFHLGLTQFDFKYIHISQDNQQYVLLLNKMSN